MTKAILFCQLNKSLDLFRLGSSDFDERFVLGIALEELFTHGLKVISVAKMSTKAGAKFHFIDKLVKLSCMLERNLCTEKITKVVSVVLGEFLN